MKLVYHNPKTSGHVSPFDDALMQVARQANPLLIMSPYIGFSSISRIIDEANDWKLLSDIEAWLAAGNQRHRAKCWRFIEDNITRIRHIPNLHAKVAIGNNKVFLGSANFTEIGLLSRTELSVLIDDPKTVAESVDWFSSLWVSASQPVIEEGDALIEAINNEKRIPFKTRIKLSSSARVVSSVLSNTTRPATGYDVAASLAKAEIAENSRYTNFIEAYSSVSDRLYLDGHRFTFGQLFQLVSKVYPTVSTRDLWSAITRETPHHPIGGLMLDGFDRYSFKQGMFQPWQPSDINLLSRIDQYLTLIIDALPFLESKSYFPNEEKITKLGLPTFYLQIMLQQLLDSGLVIEHDEPGDIEKYSLDPDFDWPARWLKFSKSRVAYEEKLKILVTPVVHENKLTDVNESKEKNTEFVNMHSIPKTINQYDRELREAMLNELQKEASLLNVDVEALRQSHDLMISGKLNEIRSKAVLKKGIYIVSHRDLIDLISVMSKNRMPTTLIKEFMRYAFSDYTFDKKPNKYWLSDHYLALYPLSLSVWKQLF